jgi:hypothetical protein
MITNTLPGFEQINQLTQTENGQLDVDRDWDCVAASLAMGLTYLTGRQYYEHDLRVAVYGANYTGGMAASAYVAYCAAQGVTLAPYNGNPTQLVAEIHASLEAGDPVVGTIPSLWGIPVVDQKPGWTMHCICFAGYGPGELRAANPWIDPEWQDQPDSYWEAELCENQVWRMSMGVPTGWKDDGNTLTAPNGKTVVHGFREHVINHVPQWSAALQPLEEEWDDSPGNVHQRFALTLEWSSSTNLVGEAGGLVPALSGGLVPVIVTDSAPAQTHTDPAIVTDLHEIQVAVNDAIGRIK